MDDYDDYEAEYQKPKKPASNLPPVSEMVVESIKALKDPPKYVKSCILVKP